MKGHLRVYEGTEGLLAHAYQHVLDRLLCDLLVLVHRHAGRPAGVREEKVHDSATWDALVVHCSQSDGAMSAQA